ncbi:MAG: hypothetical protein KHX40_02315 [Oscillospiraceae bacterium]|nr:hypothetical protein [Oscillospiraceae bacterium]
MMRVYDEMSYGTPDEYDSAQNYIHLQEMIKNDNTPEQYARLCAMQVFLVEIDGRIIYNALNSPNKLTRGQLNEFLTHCLY